MKKSQEIIVPTSSADLEVIRNELKSASEILQRIELEKEKIKDIVSGLSETFNLPNRLVAKMVTTFHKANIEEIVEDADNLSSILEAIGIEK